MVTNGQYRGGRSPRPGCDDDISDRDVWAEAEANRVELVASGRLLSFDALLAALQATPRDIDRELRDGRIFSVELAGQLYYPAFFADSTIDRAVLGSVSMALGGMPGWTKYDFFVSRRESLGEKSPLEALAAGAVALVLDFSQRFRAEVS